ncbi:hypothetical protein KNE206_01610 [Kitasatospora sp. NE20-6]
MFIRQSARFIKRSALAIAIAGLPVRGDRRFRDPADPTVPVRTRAAKAESGFGGGCGRKRRRAAPRGGVRPGVRRCQTPSRSTTKIRVEPAGISGLGDWLP